jgi:hypothetical protein
VGVEEDVGGVEGDGPLPQYNPLIVSMSSPRIDSCAVCSKPTYATRYMKTQAVSVNNESDVMSEELSHQ